MYPTQQEHRFGPQGEYLLKRQSRAGERRIMQLYALSLSTEGITPGLLQALDGDNRYWECVLRECLVEAPPHWWEDGPAMPGVNGARARVLSFETVSVDEFADVIQEAGTWFNSFRRPDVTVSSDASTGPSDAVATVETVPAAFRGQAS